MDQEKLRVWTLRSIHLNLFRKRVYKRLRIKKGANCNLNADRRNLLTEKM